MIHIPITVTGAKLRLAAKDYSLASGNIEAVQCSFEFDTAWDGFAPTAVFYYKDDEKYAVPLDGNSQATIPWETLTKYGTVFVGVFGTDNSTARITTNFVGLPIAKGAVEGGEPAPPTPGIYDQIIEELGNKLDKTDVVANLTTDSDTKPLAASQGKLLQNYKVDKIDYDDASDRPLVYVETEEGTESIPATAVHGANTVAIRDNSGRVHTGSNISANAHAVNKGYLDSTLENYAEKLTAKPFLMPGRELPTYNTATKTLAFNSDSIFKCMLYYGSEKYDIPVDTVVVDNNATTAVQLVFNTDTKVFRFIGHSEIMTAEEIRVAAYKRLEGFYEWDFPCGLLVDGALIGTQWGATGIVMTYRAINYDTTTRIITFPNVKSNIIAGNKYYEIPANVQIDLNYDEDYRKVIYYDINTGTIESKKSLELPTITPAQILIGAQWIDSFYLNGLYSIDGVPFGVTGSYKIPHYFEEEIKDTILKVQQNSEQPSLVFNIISDTHYDNVDYLEATGANIQAVSDTIKPNAIIHLGDVVEGNLPKEETQQKIGEVYKALNLTRTPVFVLMGNHDDNSYVPNYPPEDVIDKGLWYGITQRQEDMIVEREGNKPYFYIDYPKLNICALMLCASDYPDGYTGRTYWGYSEEQIDWLGEVALEMRSNYDIIVFSHMPTRAELNFEEFDNIHNGDKIEAVLNAYNNKTTYTTPTGKELDFTDKPDCKVIAFIHGHTHGDNVKVVTGCDFPFISIACAMPAQMPAGLLPSGATAPVRQVGTVTQECWDVMTIRPDEEKIYMTRFGAGNDRVIDYSQP